MALADLSLQAFLDDLGSDKPTPGGGGAAALTGANAAGLVGMVARLTVKHPEFAQHQTRFQTMIETADTIREELRNGIDSDAAAFGALMASYKLPKTSPEEKQTRSVAIQNGLVAAAESPLKIARRCGQLIAMALELAENGNPHTVSDAGAAALLAESALRSALLQVRINLKSLKDATYVQACRDEIENLEHVAAEQCQQTLAATLTKL
jgi:formiminotetrahydrofolate cyclodeaminase